MKPQSMKEAKSTAPFWSGLPEYAHNDLSGAGYDQEWFDTKTDVVRQTVLNVYVKINRWGLNLWRFVFDEASTHDGCLEFFTMDVRQLKAELTSRWDFRDPEASLTKWDSAEKRATASLHFKHFGNWPENKVQAHIDQAGLWLGSKSLWWAGIPVTGPSHLDKYDSYKDDVFGTRDILVKQGWDRQVLLGVGV